MIRLEKSVKFVLKTHYNFKGEINPILSKGQ